MKLGKVIGRVVSTKKLECYEGLKLLLVQPLDEHLNNAGSPIVAYDTVRSGEGDIVFFESGKEAAQANPNGWFNPGDAAIIGVVDAVNTDDARGSHSPRATHGAHSAGETL